MKEKKGEQIERVMLLASSLPRRDLGGVGFCVVVIDTSMEPVTVGINMEVVQASELVLRMVLQVVGLDHFVFSRLTLILVSVSIRVLSAFERLGSSVVRRVKVLLFPGSCSNGDSVNAELFAS